MCNNPCQICGDADDCEILRLNKSLSSIPLLNKIEATKRISKLISENKCTFESPNLEVFNGSK